jgi:transposase-like protein
VGKKARKIMATRKRHSPGQVVHKLISEDRLLAEGKDTAAVCRELGVSEATYHRWRNQFGGLKADRQAAQGPRSRKLHPQAAIDRCRAGEGCAQRGREVARGNF